MKLFNDRCPQGYEGSSCESCDAGYYKDLYFDQSRPLGSCTRCPCNDREESCELGPDHRVMCNCRPEWTGRNCEFEGWLKLNYYNACSMMIILEKFCGINIK